MTSPDALGDRMKGYEHACRAVLPRRMPVVIRVDGKAFHTYTRGMGKPFDHSLIRYIDLVALSLCKEIQGAQLAYVQSDEVSILVHNYKRFSSEAWFDNGVQKMVSAAAGVASAEMTRMSPDRRPAVFDARAFVLPEADVCNYFLWRQQDATRNSIQMLARSLYSHSQCDNKNTSELQEMCFQAGHNWNDLQTHLKRGRCAVRADGAWGIDGEPPMFSDDRDYVNRHLAVDEA